MADVTLSLNGSTPEASPDPVRIPKGGNLTFKAGGDDAMFMVIAQQPQEFNGQAFGAPNQRGGQVTLNIKQNANPGNVKYHVVYQASATSDVYVADPIIVIEDTGGGSAPRRG